MRQQGYPTFSISCLTRMNMKNEPKNKPYQHIPLNDPFGDESQDNRETQERQDDQEFAGLEQPNLYHFNINNETEDQAVKRLDAEIRVCMRQYTITAIRDKAMELPDVTYMMKLYMKLVAQELKARELSIKERQLALRERAMALKEQNAGKARAQNSEEMGEGMAPPEIPSAGTSAVPSQLQTKHERKERGQPEPKPPKPSIESQPPKKQPSQKHAAREETFPDLISPDGTSISVDAIYKAAGYDIDSFEPLNGKAKKTR